MADVNLPARIRVEVIGFRRRAVRLGQLPWPYLKLRTLRSFRRRRWGIDKAPLAVVLLVFDIIAIGGKVRLLERHIVQQAVNSDDPIGGASNEAALRFAVIGSGQTR